MMEDRKYPIKAYLYDQPELNDQIQFWSNDVDSCSIEIAFYSTIKDKFNLENKTVSVVIDKSDGAKVTSYATVTGENTALWQLTTNELTVGTNKATIQVYSGTERLTFGTFKYKVLTDPEGGQVTGNNNYPILVQLINDVQTALNSVSQTNENISQQELTRENNEENRISAEAIRISNENTRVLNETDRINRFNAMTTEQQQDMEVVDARQGKATLRDNIQDVKSQLAEMTTEYKNINYSLENANAKDILEIKNYLGNYQNIHPKVLYFPNKFNGYSYWMAYTPYPKGSISDENPCIACSNDRVNWITPSGLTNPLFAQPIGGYNSDTHLVYREDLNRLEVFWRTVIDEGLPTHKIIFYRRTSVNGINWTATETLLETTPTLDMLSPTIIFEDNKYKIWYCLSGYLFYREADSNFQNLTIRKSLPINWTTENLFPWHLDVIRTEIGYEFIVCCFDKTNGNNNTADLYYILQDNQGNYTQPYKILARSKNITSIDYKAIYRSSILKIAGTYHIFYSCIDSNDNRYMSITSGTDVKALNGFINLQKTKASKKYNATTNQNFINFDVTNVDIIAFTSDITVNGFTGGYYGKELILIPENSTSKCTFVYNSSNIITPNGENFSFNYNTYNYVKVIFTTPTQVRLDVVNMDILKSESTNAMNDYNVDFIDTIIFSDTNLIINSLSCSKLGKKINIVVGGSSAKCTLKYNSRILTPGLTDMTFGIERMGVTLICTSLANGGVFRAF